MGNQSSGVKQCCWICTMKVSKRSRALAVSHSLGCVFFCCFPFWTCAVHFNSSLPNSCAEPKGYQKFPVSRSAQETPLNKPMCISHLGSSKHIVLLLGLLLWTPLIQLRRERGKTHIHIHTHTHRTFSWITLGYNFNSNGCSTTVTVTAKSFRLYPDKQCVCGSL